MNSEEWTLMVPQGPHTTPNCYPGRSQQQNDRGLVLGAHRALATAIRLSRGTRLRGLEEVKHWHAEDIRYVPKPLVGDTLSPPLNANNHIPA